MIALTSVPKEQERESGRTREERRWQHLEYKVIQVRKLIDYYQEAYTHIWQKKEANSRYIHHRGDKRVL